MTASLAGDTLTFLFTDIEGSTRRWEERTEELRLALATHDSILRSAIEGNQGSVFKTVGDAFYAAFSTAPDALAAAVDAQYALQAEAWGAVGPLRVRMALHTGAVELRDGDYFGPPLNRVARLLNAGHGGQVLLSEATASFVRDVLFGGMALRDKGEHRQPSRCESSCARVTPRAALWRQYRGGRRGHEDHARRDALAPHMGAVRVGARPH